MDWIGLVKSRFYSWSIKWETHYFKKFYGRTTSNVGWFWEWDWYSNCAHCTILPSKIIFEKETYGECQQNLSVMLWRWSSMCRCCRFVVSWRCNWMLQRIFSISSPNNALSCYPNVKLSVKNLSLNISTAPIVLQSNYGLEFGCNFISLHIFSLHMCRTHWQDKQNPYLIFVTVAMDMSV